MGPSQTTFFILLGPFVLEEIRRAKILYSFYQLHKYGLQYVILAAQLEFNLEPYLFIWTAERQAVQLPKEWSQY